MYRNSGELWTASTDAEAAFYTDLACGIIMTQALTQGPHRMFARHDAFSTCSDVPTLWAPISFALFVAPGSPQGGHGVIAIVTDVNRQLRGVFTLVITPSSFVSFSGCGHFEAPAAFGSTVVTALRCFPSTEDPSDQCANVYSISTRGIPDSHVFFGTFPELMLTLLQFPYRIVVSPLNCDLA